MTWREMFRAIPANEMDGDVSVFVDGEWISFADVPVEKALLLSSSENDSPMDDGNPFISLQSVVDSL